MYCPRCKQLFEGSICPFCGATQVRAPFPDDECFLIETGMLMGEMLADLLRREKIPFYFKSSLGAGLAMCIGPYQDVYRFFVPYACWTQAQEQAAFLCSTPQEEPYDEAEDET